MKTFIKTFSLAVALALALFAGQVRAQDAPAATGDSDVSFQTFYDQLANQGSWINTNQYGYVFQPTENDPNWQPYTYGHWVNTDQGMTWVSDESFGWATYHYGRWVNLDGTGWVWVPGYTWAPAWVSWREDADDVGWAPLPPDSDNGIDYYDSGSYADFGFGFHIGDDCDTAFGIGPACYNFCPIAYIGDPYPWRHFRDHRDNFAFIGRTRNVTNINFRRGGEGRFSHVTAEGPSVARLNERSRTPIEHAQLTSATNERGAGLHGRSLSVFAPRVDPATRQTARPGAVSRTLANTSVNRGTDINRPLAVNSRVRAANPTAEQVHAATLDQGNAAQARVATTNTHFTRSLSQPLTSLRTTAPTNRTAENPASRFTGAESVAPRVTRSSSVESAFTGEAPGTRETVRPHVSSNFGGAQAYAPNGGYRESAFPHTSTPAYHPQANGSGFGANAPAYHPEVFHTSTPAYHPQVSAPVFHTSAPAYHPSFHAAAPAPQPHFSGGGFSGGGGGFHAAAPAPAAHFSGGGGGAAHVGGGGGGGGHAGGGGGHR